MQIDQKKKSVAKRLQKYSARNHDTGCLEWHGYKDVYGYGVLPKWIEEGLVEVVTDQFTNEDVVEITATKACSSLNDLCSRLHESNFQAGWWNDINTGEDMRSNVYPQLSPNFQHTISS